ncbi:MULTISPECIES: DUF2171 domain-containing protein [Sphingomonas]|uniref:DUF2171 domain-containing protein n=1 Tax=Sphingomonas TaxID=13687 RepID=UPI000DEFBCA0|nr:MULTISPECIES: DUF2171 domain-containing protein [Sphingomonas]
MAYDRYDRGSGYRDEDRYSSRNSMSGDRDRGGDNRGFWDRARDEVQSWFGDESSGGRRDRDARMDRDRFGSDRNDRGAFFGNDRDRDDRSGFGGRSSYGQGQSDYRSQSGRSGDYARQERSPWGSTNYSEDDRADRGRDYPSAYGQRSGGYSSSQGQNWDRDQDRSSRGFQSQGGDRYQPLTGDYGRGSDMGRSGMGSQDFSREQYGRQDYSQDQRNDRMFGGDRDRDDDRSRNRGGFVGAASGAGASLLGRGSSPHDDHYSSWRQRQIDELDNDYHAYRQEHQSRFENEFTGFRQQRQTKRELLGQVREHFEVVDQSGERIGTVDKVRGDKVILTKHDPEANGVHRSFSCQLLDKVEGNKVTLNGTKDSLRNQLHEERGDDRGSGGFLGGLFGSDRDDRDNRDRSNRDRDDLNRQNSMTGATGSTGAATMSGSTGSTDSTSEGPHILDRSFSGTYDDGSKKA